MTRHVLLGSAVEQFAAQPSRAATAMVERMTEYAGARTSRGRWSPESACSRGLCVFVGLGEGDIEIAEQAWHWDSKHIVFS